MTREEFASLPPKIALEVLYDIARAKLEPLTRPDVPRAPLYDGRLSRGNKGFTFMSEMLLRDLEWWEKKKSESAESGSQYAEKDRKTAATLRAWIAWRKLFPSELWSGKRDEDRVTAAPPSRDPKLHEWGPRAGGSGKRDEKPSNKGPDPWRGEEEESNEF